MTGSDVDMIEDMIEDGGIYTDGSSSVGSNTLREQRRRDSAGATHQQLFKQHSLQQLFDNRHHDLNFDDDDDSLLSGGHSSSGDRGPNLGGNPRQQLLKMQSVPQLFDNRHHDLNFEDNREYSRSISGSSFEFVTAIRTDEEIRQSAIARRRRLSQMESAMNDGRSLDLTLSLTQSRQHSSSQISSLKDSIISLDDSLGGSSASLVKIGSKDKNKKKGLKKSPKAERGRKGQRKHNPKRNDRETDYIDDGSSSDESDLVFASKTPRQKEISGRKLDRSKHNHDKDRSRSRRRRNQDEHSEDQNFHEGSSVESDLVFVQKPQPQDVIGDLKLGNSRRKIDRDKSRSQRRVKEEYLNGTSSDESDLVFASEFKPQKEINDQVIGRKKSRSRQRLADDEDEELHQKQQERKQRKKGTVKFSENTRLQKSRRPKNGLRHSMNDFVEETRSDLRSAKMLLAKSASTSMRSLRNLSMKHDSSSDNAAAIVYYACNQATGMCAFHPDVQLRKKARFGGWKDVLKSCPKCAETHAKTPGGDLSRSSRSGSRASNSRGGSRSGHVDLSVDNNLARRGGSVPRDMESSVRRERRSSTVSHRSLSRGSGASGDTRGSSKSTKGSRVSFRQGSYGSSSRDRNKRREQRRKAPPSDNRPRRLEPTSSSSTEERMPSQQQQRVKIQAGDAQQLSMRESSGRRRGAASKSLNLGASKPFPGVPPPVQRGASQPPRKTTGKARAKSMMPGVGVSGASKPLRKKMSAPRAKSMMPSIASRQSMRMSARQPPPQQQQQPEEMQSTERPKLSSTRRYKSYRHRPPSSASREPTRSLSSSLKMTARQARQMLSGSYVAQKKSKSDEEEERYPTQPRPSDPSSPKSPFEDNPNLPAFQRRGTLSPPPSRPGDASSRVGRDRELPEEPPLRQGSGSTHRDTSTNMGTERTQKISNKRIRGIRGVVNNSMKESFQASSALKSLLLKKEGGGNNIDLPTDMRKLSFNSSENTGDFAHFQGNGGKAHNEDGMFGFFKDKLQKTNPSAFEEEKKMSDHRLAMADESQNSRRSHRSQRSASLENTDAIHKRRSYTFHSTPNASRPQRSASLDNTDGIIHKRRSNTFHGTPNASAVSDESKRRRRRTLTADLEGMGISRKVVMDFVTSESARFGQSSDNLGDLERHLMVQVARLNIVEEGEITDDKCLDLTDNKLSALREVVKSFVDGEREKLSKECVSSTTANNRSGQKHRGRRCYKLGDEGRRRDMIKDDDKGVALMRIASLRPDNNAFIRRTTGKWTYARVKNVSSDSIIFVVNTHGSLKEYNVKHWVRYIRTIKAQRVDEVDQNGGGSRDMRAEFAKQRSENRFSVKNLSSRSLCIFSDDEGSS